LHCLFQKTAVLAIKLASHAVPPVNYWCAWWRWQCCAGLYFSRS